MKFKWTSKFRDEGNLRAIKLRAIKIDCTYRRVDTGIPAEISTSATSSSSSGQRTSGQAAPSPPLYMCTTTPSLFIVGLSPSGSCCHLSSGHQDRRVVPFIGKDKQSTCSRESHYHREFNRKNDYTHDNRCKCRNDNHHNNILRETSNFTWLGRRKTGYNLQAYKYNL